MDFVSLSLFCDLFAFEMVEASAMVACSQVTNKDWGVVALWQSRRCRMGSGFYSSPDHCSHMELLPGLFSFKGCWKFSTF